MQSIAALQRDKVRSELLPHREYSGRVWGGAGAVAMLRPYSPRHEFVRRYRQVQTTDYDKAHENGIGDLQLHATTAMQECHK